MIKKIIASLLLFTSFTAEAAHLKSRQIDLNTHKTTTIAGEINDGMVSSVIIQQKATSDLPGPRLVLIRSPGGMLTSGAKIIEILEAERAVTHQKLVCMVIGAAHSMAFNILSHCDVRMATADATMVVHKCAISGFDENGPRPTARNLRKLADEMDKMDEANSALNAKMMHLTRAQYDEYAAKETRWTAYQLYIMGYLTGIATLD